MADLPQPPPGNAYLTELVAALENRLTRMEATQRERYAVENLAAAARTLDAANADLAALRETVGTLITDLSRKGVI